MESDAGRPTVCRRLALLGLPELLADAGGDAVIAPGGDGPTVVVVTAREDAQMARETRQALRA